VILHKYSNPAPTSYEALKNMKRIVILGGGAGGAVVAHRLSKRLKDDAEIILVDKRVS